MSTASAKSLRSKLVRKAYENPGLREKLLPIIKQAGQHESKLSAEQQTDLADAIKLARDGDDSVKVAAAKNPTVEIKSLPSMSPGQVRAMLAGIVAARQQASVIESQISDQLKKLKDLSKEEKAGIDQIKKCGGLLAEKTNYLLETEKYLLKFKATMTAKKPGVEQLMAGPESAKAGTKSGDLVGKIHATFEKEVAAQVINLLEACIGDATHFAKFAQAIKIVEKTSSVPQGVVKNAGLVDTVVAIKEWVVGGTNSIMQRILNFSGDLKKWVMGFVERGRIAKSSKDKLVKGLGSIDKMVGALEKEAI